MASKHAKLKLALTRAIIDFFLQEDLYADELKIQGTLCVTADRSAIFVTQITETVNDTATDGGTLLPSCNLKKSNSLYADPHRVYSINNVATDCPEDLTCNSGRRRTVERQPPAAHTKHHTPLNYKPPLSCLTSPKPTTSRGNKSEPWPLSLNKTNNDVQELQSMSRTAAPVLNTPSLSLLENKETRTDNFFSLNSAILNAAAKSAIERLTSLSRENEQLQTVCATNAINWGQDGGSKATNAAQPQAEVIDCSSSKKRRLDVPCLLEIGPQLDSALTVVTPHSNDLDIPQGGHLIIDDQPLMLVTPKRERISDDEGDGAENGCEGGNGLVGTNSITKNSNKSASCESSPKEGQNKLHSPPSTVGQPAAGGGCLSPWSFSTANMKEEPSSVPDWSGADWMRKPRTKFSQEQLKALETEYKNDPFLSTSADKRAELARRLNITEKNVQIWFQNQRRRRRAAAYSHMHYTLNDAPGDKAHDFTTNNVDNADNTTIGSPEFISDHEGENSRNCTPGRDGEHDMEIVRKHIAVPHRVSYEASLDDSNSSDLIIATDFPIQDTEMKENHEHDSSEGHSKGHIKGQIKSHGQQGGKSEGENNTKGQCEKEGQEKGEGQNEGEGQNVGEGQNEIEGENEGQIADKVPPDTETETEDAGSSSPDSPQPTSPKGKSGSGGSDVHEMNGRDA